MTCEGWVCAKIRQTVWKQFRLSGDKSRKLLSAMFEHLAQDAGCGDAIVVHVDRSSGQYRASRHPRAAAIIASTPRMLSARRKL
jgi:hypothetical protein